MFVHRKLSRFMLMALCALPLAAGAAPHYGITVVGSAGSAASDINLGGQVVGQYTDGGGNQRAFLYAGSTLHDLGTLGGSSAAATAINDGGQVVGYASNGLGNDRAFSYLGGVMSDLGTLGGDSSRAYGLNNAGRIVGSAQSPAGTEAENGVAFSYANGSMQSLGFLPASNTILRSRALGVNLQGQIVGVSSATDIGPTEFPEQAFLYSNNTMVNLGTLGGLFSTARSINESGLIAGQASTDLDPDNIGHKLPHAFIYINGMMIDLGALTNVTSYSDAQDVNNLGQVVGTSGFAGVDGLHAFLYQAGSMQDINQLIDPLSGWTVTDAAAINDVAQIAGTACRDGQCYAVRLDLLAADIPEPGAWLLTATGLALLGCTTARRRSTRS